MADDGQERPALWMRLGELLAVCFRFIHATGLQLVRLQDERLRFKTMISPELFPPPPPFFFLTAAVFPV